MCECFRNYVCLRCEAKQRVRNSPLANRKVAECGTRAGYNRHLKLKEPTCAECKQAQLEAVQKWKREKANV